MTEEFNPYAAPTTEVLPGNANARSIRLENMRAESNAKAMGVFFLFGSMLALLAMFKQANVLGKELEVLHLPRASAALILPFIAGVGLCCLRRWGWGLAVVYHGFVAVINLTDLPRSIVMLLIGTIVLRFLLHRKTLRVFAKDYAGLVAATPELRSPVASWGWGMAVLCGLIAAVLAFFM